MSKKSSIALSRELNQLLNGNQGQTVSKQTAKGIQRRTDKYISDDEAMRMGHNKMIRAGAGFALTPVLFRIHPLLGIASAIFSAVNTADAVNDWHEGADTYPAPRVSYKRT